MAVSESSGELSDVACQMAQHTVPVMLWEALEHAAGRDAASNALLEVVIAGGRLAGDSLLLIGR